MVALSFEREFLEAIDAVTKPARSAAFRKSRNPRRGNVLQLYVASACRRRQTLLQYAEVAGNKPPARNVEGAWS
jgi:hypothetical protein